MKESLSAPRIERFSFSPRFPIYASVNPNRNTFGPWYDMHYSFEMGVVLKGRAVRHYQGYSQTIGPGEMYFCGVWEPHGYQTIEIPFVTLNFEILPDMLVSTFFEEAPDINWIAPFVVPPEQRPHLKGELRARILGIANEIAERLQRESPETANPESRPDANNLWLRLETLRILDAIFSEWSPDTNLPRQSYTGFRRIYPAIELVFNSTESISTGEAAKVCSMSYSVFYRMFQNLMGLTFAKFALRYRVNAAARQLAGSDDPIKAISDAWGFTDASHFLRCFQDLYGCTPGEYRNRIGSR